MYTVLLVDDELPILDTLKASVSWSDFGIDQVLTAMDGWQAIDVIKNKEVHLLITDIKMPNLNGLELLELVRKEYPGIHCILLTAYSDFEYAKRALNLGIENYLLKPFQKEELEETIEKAIDNIYTQYEISQHLFRSNMLNRWVNGTIHTEELADRAGLLNINLFLPQYCVICTLPKNRVSISEYMTSCIEKFSSKYHVLYFLDSRNHHTLILGGELPKVHELQALLEDIFTRSFTGLSLIQAIGTIVEGSDALAESYQTASKLIETANTASEGHQILSNETFLYPNDDLLTDKVTTFFYSLSEDCASDKIQTLIEDLARQYPGDFAYLFSLLTQSILQFFAQEFSAYTDIQEQIHNRILLIQNPVTKDLFISCCQDLLEFSYLLFCYAFKQLSPIIQSTISYIQTSYPKNISIKDFSNKNKINMAYLGYLFKKETGMFFNNYLMQYRICRSLTMLRNTTLKIQDIAAKNGFTTTSHYISVFKKQTGFSPLKYRALKFKE